MSRASSEQVRPTHARIDLPRLGHNLRQIRQAVGPQVAIVAVVKADAYGHGAVPVSRMLEGLGVRGFAVSTVEEGLELRAAGIRAPILVMGGAFGQGHQTVIDHDLIPVLSNAVDLTAFAAAAKRRSLDRYGVHVKIDTGMSRLGVRYDEFEAFLRQCAAFAELRVDGLMTHLATAESEQTDFVELQLARFERCLQIARALGADPQWIHAANSAAALRYPHSRFDLIRPGLVLYGALPSEAMSEDPGLLPVMSVHTSINAIRQVPAGTTVSYGQTFCTTRESRLATIPLGYADGYPRALSSRGQVLIDGRRVPVVGRVCMDLTVVDVTELEGVQIGQQVTVLGEQGGESISPAEFAEWAGTIPYEIFTGISRRVPRIYPGLEPTEVEIARGTR